MNNPSFVIWNKHGASCGEAPTITNQGGTHYCGYFENRYGDQWVFVYDRERKIGELRGGDLGWDQVVLVEDGTVNVNLGSEETAWLHACWTAATGHR